LGCEHASHRSGLLLAAHLGVHGQLGRELTIEAGLRLVRLTQLLLFVDIASHIELVVDVLDYLILLLAAIVGHVRRPIEQFVNVVVVTLATAVLISLDFVHQFGFSVFFRQILEVLSAFGLSLRLLVVGVSDGLLDLATVFLVNLLLSDYIVESLLVLGFELLTSINFALHSLIVLPAFEFVLRQSRFDLRQLLDVLLALFLAGISIALSLVIDLLEEFLLHLGALFCKLVLLVSLLILELVEILLHDLIPLIFVHVQGARRRLRGRGLRGGSHTRSSARVG